ncbi:hypothetical protein V5799_010150 [Amblyomma americanum]|uniref:Uncharacterized protein n=1 Tax=Amblyomma americanum TaxID=6943 RepID=A0AAQ4F9Y8_AMBAM
MKHHSVPGDFESWKDHEEKTELVHFVLSGGTKHLASGGTKKYLVCHRSGLYVKTGRDARSPARAPLDRLHLLTSSEVQNIKMKFNIGSEVEKDRDDYVSTQKWIVELQDHGALLYAEADKLTAEGIGEFVMAMMNTTQGDILLKHSQRAVCVDSTHGTNRYV